MSTSGGTESHLKDIKRCGFYVQRKRRHCRMIPAKGNMYCAEHLCFQDESFAVTRDAGNGNEGYGSDVRNGHFVQYLILKVKFSKLLIFFL